MGIKVDKDNEFYDLDSVMKKSEAEEEHKEKKGLFYGGLVTGLAVAFVIVAAVFLGTRLQQWFDVNGAGRDSVMSSSLIRKMQTIEDMITEYYYQNEDIDVQEMENGIYRGMIQSTGDPYSDYYSAKELEEQMQQIQGVYYGIGAGVNIDPETSLPRIARVYEDTPAQEAGLRENDLIYEVEGESTYGMSTTDVVALIKGEEGTKVNLTIVREGESDYLSIDVERREVNVPTVEWRMLDAEKAYIQITEFDKVTPGQFAEALKQARDSGMKGLILDLRSNPGGNLDAVVEIAQMILPGGLIVYTEDKYGQRMEYRCDGTEQMTEELVVLINGNSASASEILAGAIKDYELGTLVGTTTFGKGIVQTVFPLKDGSAVKMTVSSYFTPKGNNIHGVGIAPDVECIFDGEAYYLEPDHPDNQLEEAKRVLEELMREGN